MSCPEASPFAAAVLAGGRSTRMGRDKALLPWGNSTFLNHQLAQLAALQPAELFLSARAEAPYGSGCERVVDELPDRGPLGGLVALLRRARSPHLLVLAVDLPHISVPLLRRLLSARLPGSGVIPRSPRGWEPLAAVYPRTMLADLDTALHSGQLRLQGLIESAVEAGKLRPWVIPPSEFGVFRNYNAPEDFPPRPVRNAPP